MNKMRLRCANLPLFPTSFFVSGVHRPFSSITVHLRDIHLKAASFGGSSTADFPEQVVGEGAGRRRSVAGVDQEELLDPENLADHDSLFFEISGVNIHHKKCHYDATEDVKKEEDEAFRGKIGFPAILLHGFGASVFSWGRIMKPLSCIIGSKVLAFDRPAFGLTSRTSYIEISEPGGSNGKPLNPYSMDFSVLATLSFIGMLGAKKAVLMGHSAGCFVALNAYFESPDHVAALILVAPAIFAPLGANKGSNCGAVWNKKKEEEGALDFKDPFSSIRFGLWKLCGMMAAILLGMLKGWMNMISLIFARAVAAVLRTPFGVMMVRLVLDKFGILAIQNAWYDASQVTSDVLQGYTKPLRVKGWERALLEYTIAMLIGSASKPKPPLLKRLNQIKCPVLIVTGDTDRIVPSWNARRLAQAIPGATFAVISKCGHLPHEEKPDEFLEVVEKFLSRTFSSQKEKFTKLMI